ncbi:MAG: cellulase family glycosylhydrolase [Phycisphaera sp.]|nr:cellulase family glycosylhydrolase [Phycisphaera sp.]
MRLILIALVLLSITPYVAALDITEANTRLGRGVNLGNALEAPVEGKWGVTLDAAYFKLIKEAGFDTVRLPVRWSAHAGEQPPFALDETFAERVDWAIDQALENNLNIIVNVHHYEEVFTDPAQHLPRLGGIWSQIAARYKDRPSGVYFELLNEPHDKLDAPTWNAAIPSLLAAVRKTNPTRAVIVGPVQWNSIDKLDTLELPQDDANLIVTVHFYEPFKFTHQGASWVKGADRWQYVPWLGHDKDKQDITARLESAARWAKDHNRPLFLGEFGAYSKADMDSRVRWMRFVSLEARRLGMSWAYWEFCSGFGLYDPKADRWRDELRDALLKP